MAEQKTNEQLILELAAVVAAMMHELNQYILSIDFYRLTNAEYAKVTKKIDKIFTKYEKELAKWSDEAIETAYKRGATQAIIDLGETRTVEEALKLLNLDDRINAEAIKLLKETTYNDLLQMTNNTKRRVKDMLSRVVFEVMKGREIGVDVREFSRTIISRIRQEAVKEIDFAIIDRAGREWSVKSYSEMVARTKITQAQLIGVENEALRRDGYYGLISSHGSKCNLCRPWEGKVVKLRSDAEGNFPLLSEIKSVRGRTSIFHPRCRHHVRVLRTLDVLPPQVKEKNNIPRGEI